MADGDGSGEVVMTEEADSEADEEEDIVELGECASGGETFVPEGGG